MLSSKNINLIFPVGRTAFSSNYGNTILVSSQLRKGFFLWIYKIIALISQNLKYKTGDTLRGKSRKTLRNRRDTRGNMRKNSGKWWEMVRKLGKQKLRESPTIITTQETKETVLTILGPFNLHQNCKKVDILYLNIYVRFLVRTFTSLMNCAQRWIRILSHPTWSNMWFKRLESQHAQKRYFIVTRRITNYLLTKISV